MSENLERQYDEVVSYINGYRLFESRVINRLNPIRSPMRSLKLLAQFPKLWLEVNPLSGKTSEFSKTTLTDYATDEEKTTDYFRAAVADYSIDCLSAILKETFVDVDFNKLKKIHDSRKTELQRFSVRQATGFMLAAGTLLLRSVPRSVVETTFGIPYQTFEIKVFWVTVILTGYVALIMLPAWFKYEKARSTHQQVAYILEYTAIKSAD